MNLLEYRRTHLPVCSVLLIWQPFQVRAEQNSNASRATLKHTPTERDGQHDFDFEIWYLENAP